MGADQSGQYNSNVSGIQYEDVKSNPEDVKKHQNDAPQSSYAVLAPKRPVLLKQVSETLNGSKISKSVSGSSSGSNLPVYELLGPTQKGLFYEGQWKNGRQNGRGIVRGVNGTYLQAYFNNGKAEGKGFYIYPDGSFYSGQFKNAHYNGKGLFYYKINEMTYEGDWKDGKPHGEGKQIFPEIGTYKGGFVNGLKHGKGNMQWNDGRQYQGGFYEGYMHGEGTLEKNKGLYKGQFDHNNKVKGLMKTQLGEYNGPFVRGQMSGNGKFTWNNGNIYEGDFKFNKMHGNGTMILKNRQSFKGQWKNGTNIKIAQ